ncbi:hypothetical protein UlMin_028544, partial [Ulmus minor]
NGLLQWPSNSQLVSHGSCASKMMPLILLSTPAIDTTMIILLQTGLINQRYELKPGLA